MRELVCVCENFVVCVYVRGRVRELVHVCESFVVTNIVCVSVCVW